VQPPLISTPETGYPFREVVVSPIFTIQAIQKTHFFKPILFSAVGTPDQHPAHWISFSTNWIAGIAEIVQIPDPENAEIAEIAEIADIFDNLGFQQRIEMLMEMLMEMLFRSTILRS